ncbi:hypothetical protein Achl_3295 [Pseudarthrobacter chlorophenolicus A6]|uniref:Integral membrane protein n=1 Tax=Pseudarthrobacter chlorophenolicus (strain ATCC 700700 / DSM 12829 / CIP 107037 / JCM 12360 / KCTC 9906 / NCIMB 13794 / A6) TaxID=452863 RepID=B8HGI9_PSECP|nr:hypothetical protein [Pseudarthrobacter chlorophenolicus]ACL41255.1 hypothetical protein Achl_3295 [Pseudarthrobacter chlorophenolicus A6]SDQ67522.1 hypothetical protein SAMN04489738_2185 [Pseudarthrobacter chlorophenolicus]
MDYNDFEFVAFWVLSSVPGLVLVAAGTIAHQKSAKGWISRYLIIGIPACFLYAACAGILALQLFPPPYVAGLSEGRGLDLRGMGFLLGAWIGAIGGVVGALLIVAVSSMTLRFKHRREAVL